MNFIKKLFKENSAYLILLTLGEIILSIICILSFVYTDSLSYSDSLIFNELGIEKLLQSMYSSTFWALILVILSLISIFSLTSLIYKKMEYQFISICSWFVLFILAINLNKSLIDNLSVILLFIPIIIINIVAYNTQKKKNNLIKKKR